MGSANLQGLEPLCKVSDVIVQVAVLHDQTTVCTGRPSGMI